VDSFISFDYGLILFKKLHKIMIHFILV